MFIAFNPFFCRPIKSHLNWSRVDIWPFIITIMCSHYKPSHFMTPEITCKLISCLWYYIPGHHTHREKFSGRKQRLRRSPAHSWTPTIPKMKKTKKQSSSTLPSMGRVSSRSVTRILIPATQWKSNCSIISSHTRSKIQCCNNKKIRPQAYCSCKTYEIIAL